MSSLYIGGAQCVHAKFLNSDDCEHYDEHEKDLEKLATQFKVEISRYSLNEYDYSFVVMNKKVNHECFYPGASFEVDMSFEVSDTFESRAKFFIDALNLDNNFKRFHNLNWSKPKALYFVIS